MDLSTRSTTFAPRLRVGSPMSKALTILGMVVAGILGVVFLLDWILGFPFNGADWRMNLGAVIAAALLGYLSWDAMRDVR
jgi:drug/metabolite transporter (DMT)-like permease